MKTAIVSLVVILAGSPFASAQAPKTPTIAETLASTLEDLRGASESIEISPSTIPANRNGVWSSLFGTTTASPTQPERLRSSVGTVSVKRLRHQVPKAAQKAYDKGLGTKDMQKSARNLERAIALDPEFGAAHCDLGFAYTRLGLLSQAAAEFRRAIELMPEESIPYSNLAWLLFATGQRAEALANLQRALRLSPENGSARILAREMMESAR